MENTFWWIRINMTLTSLGFEVAEALILPLMEANWFLRVKKYGFNLQENLPVRSGIEDEEENEDMESKTKEDMHDLNDASILI